jgi:hypothetical protein
VVPPQDWDAWIAEGDDAEIGGKVSGFQHGIEVAGHVAARLGRELSHKLGIEAEHPGRNWPGTKPGFEAIESGTPSIVKAGKFRQVAQRIG